MFDVTSDITRAMAQLKSLAEASQFKFAVAKALTQTAYEVQAEVKRNMPGRFTLRRQWIVQGMRVERATKTNLVATVYSRDKFMGFQEFGGPKSPLRNYIAVPTKAVRRTKTQMIAKADRPKSLGDKVEVIEYKGDKYLALKAKPRKGASGNKLRLLYLLIPRAQMHERLKLRQDGERIARAKFLPNLQRAIDDAVRTAR